MDILWLYLYRLFVVSWWRRLLPKLILWPQGTYYTIPRSQSTANQMQIQFFTDSHLILPIFCIECSKKKGNAKTTFPLFSLKNYFILKTTDNGIGLELFCDYTEPQILDFHEVQRGFQMGISLYRIVNLQYFAVSKTSDFQ